MSNLSHLTNHELEASLIASVHKQRENHRRLAELLINYATSGVPGPDGAMKLEIVGLLEEAEHIAEDHDNDGLRHAVNACREKLRVPLHSRR